jgi:hypothetical protein
MKPVFFTDSYSAFSKCYTKNPKFFILCVKNVF